MNIDKIFLIVPKIIEQPTWGGRYILQTKGWTDKKLFKNLKIGQSYELFSGIKLRSDINSSLDPSFTGELGYGMEPDKVFYQGDKSKLIPITKLIKQDPKWFLGKVSLKKHGPQIKILIKFTQAKGNSFQIHVKEKDSGQKWRFKAESWYCFEQGLLTLGVKKETNWDEYKNCCLKINGEVSELSKLILNHKIDLHAAKTKAKIIIKKYNPWQYVNLVKVKKNDLIDLSEAGLHHSWEENESNLLGNVVYELCLDVMDPVATLRCFDNGKIQNNGSIRPVQIRDYFKYIDRSWKTNNSKNHLLKPKIIFNKNGVKISSLLKSKYYCLDKIEIKNSYLEKNINSFHHLFIQSGAVNLISKKSKIILTQGHSCFIPAAVDKYQIQTVEEKTILLKTYID